MFLNSLTLHGFKSFVDRTTLDVEPGITVIVGPNGSGKSNIVDALAWVLGTHAPSRIRGGSMADVIFAGGPDRGPGRRARVEISIDNADGRLGSEGLGTAGSGKQFAEVRVAREVHRDGESRYLINGQEVRALDVQELLSDTGLGRELHTIVGQGQLDAILNSRPEDRRAWIEEAAGILKHRRRRERAIRKMEAVDDHVDKLRSVLRELRRQLRPLERQAEAANKAEQLERDLHDVRGRIAAVDLAELTERLDDDHAAEQMVANRERAAADDVQRRERYVAALLDQLSEREPVAERARQTLNDLLNLQERLRGTARLVEARLRHLVEYVEEPLTARPPDQLRAQADALQLQLTGLGDQVATCRATLDQAVADRRVAEDRRRDLDRELVAEQRRRAEQRERVLRWEGEVSALRGAIATSEAEAGRVTSQLAGLDERIEEATAAIGKVTDEIQRLDADEVALTRSLERSEGRVSSARHQVDELDEQVRARETEAASLRARAEALRATLVEQSRGETALLDAGRPGLLGRLADLVRIEGPTPAVVAALGPLGSAIAADDVDSAAAAITWLRAQRQGAAHLFAVGASDPGHPAADEVRAAGGRPIGDLLTPARDDAEPVVASLRRAIRDCWLAADWEAAVLLHQRFPTQTFVTADGDLAGPRGFLGGEQPEQSAVATATAADEAEARADGLDRQLGELRKRLAAARRDLTTSNGELAEASRSINESDARITGAAEQLARLDKEQVALTNQRSIVQAQRAELLSVLERDREQLAQLNSRGPDEPDTELGGVDPDAARDLDEQVERERAAELDARVALERHTEQSRHLANQVEALRSEATSVEQTLAAAEERRRRRRQAIVTCERLSMLAARAVEAAVDSIAQAEAASVTASEALDSTRTSLETAREKAEVAKQVLGGIREDRHAADLQRAELVHEHQGLVDRINSQLGMTPEELLAAHPGATTSREKLVEKEDTLVRRIGLIGRINPLALEEFRALEERHAFLKDQLQDLRSSKRNLEQVVEAVDAKIEEVFTRAFADVRDAFADIFETLFPGGRGRLVLTDPENMLTTGIEVEARPPGKKVTRLSLLSGGERSLTVLAFVFAIFRARPSPFYVLDEVDAALDDINLQRLLTVIESFRGKAQIIMVTHQKRSMEAADVLYGVTMGANAITTVVAERFADVEIPDTPESLTTA